MTPEFWITTLVVVATPGTGVLYTLSAGLTRGARASVVAAFACTLGIVPHVVAAATGLATLLHASAVAFDVVRYLGVAYLLYLAWATWRDRTAFEPSDRPVPPSAGRVISTGVLINLLNPKLTVFFVGFLPQFVHSGDPDALPRMLELSAMFMLVTFVVFVAYGVAAAALGTRVVARPRVAAYIRRAFAATYVALAGRLAITR